MNLLDVYEVIGLPSIFAMGTRDSDSACLVEAAVNETLSQSFKEVEVLLFSCFREITLQKPYENFSEGMAEVRHQYTEAESHESFR